MNYKHNIIKERFDIKIKEAGQGYKGEFELDKNACIITAIALTSDRDDLLFYRGTQKIQLNDQELFPEDFESKLLMSGLNVAPNQRAVSIGDLPAGNGKLDVYYTDTDHVAASFTPYRVTIYVFSKIDQD